MGCARPILPASRGRSIQHENAHTRMLDRLLWMVLFLTASAFAADVHGTVTGGVNQAPITGASVLLHRPSGVHLTSVTDDKGAYHFEGLDKSLRYTLDVNLEG